MRKLYAFIVAVVVIVATTTALRACTESWDCRMNPPCASCVSYAHSIEQQCERNCNDPKHSFCIIDHYGDGEPVFDWNCLNSCENACKNAECTDINQCEDYFWVPGVNAGLTLAEPRKACDLSTVALKPAD